MSFPRKNIISWLTAVSILLAASILQASNAGIMSGMLLTGQTAFLQRFFRSSATILSFFGAWINWILITLITYTVSDVICNEVRSLSSHLFWNAIGYVVILLGAVVTRAMLSSLISSVATSASATPLPVKSVENLLHYRLARKTTSGATIGYFVWAMIVGRRLNALKWYLAPVIFVVLLGMWLLLKTVTNG